MQTEQLKEKKVKDLREIAKELDITGRHDMNKGALILAILEKRQLKEEIQVSVDYGEGESVTHTEIVEVKPVLNGIEIKEKKINEAEQGTLVAYRDVFGNVKSAAIESRNKKKKMLKLKTKYGMEFIVKYEDVVWVKDRAFWPKKVYMAFKKLTEEEYDARAKNKEDEPTS